MLKTAADQPVEQMVEGRSPRPEFLGEGLELTMGVGIAVEQVGPAIIVIAIILALVMAIGGYAGQLGPAQVIVDLPRNAPILELAHIIQEIGRTSCRERVCQ